jgi:hypothetical protein
LGLLVLGLWELRLCIGELVFIKFYFDISLWP